MPSMFPPLARRDAFYEPQPRPTTRPRQVTLGAALLGLGALIALVSGMILITTDANSVAQRVADADTAAGILSSIRVVGGGSILTGLAIALCVGPIAQGSHRARIAAILITGLGSLLLMIGFIVQAGGLSLALTALLLISGLLVVFTPAASAWFR